MPLKQLTLLYVEDDMETQRLIARILEPIVKEIYIASDGEKGLALYKEKHPDIILSDICMPIMDGLEMSREVKKIDKEQTIALFTAFNEPEYLQQAAELEIGTYILKPFNRKQFFNSLNYLAMVVEAKKN